MASNSIGKTTKHDHLPYYRSLVPKITGTGPHKASVYTSKGPKKATKTKNQARTHTHTISRFSPLRTYLNVAYSSFCLCITVPVGCFEQMNRNPFQVKNRVLFFFLNIKLKIWSLKHSDVWCRTKENDTSAGQNANYVTAASAPSRSSRIHQHCVSQWASAWHIPVNEPVPVGLLSSNKYRRHDEYI